MQTPTQTAQTLPEESSAHPMNDRIRNPESPVRVCAPARCSPVPAPYAHPDAKGSRSQEDRWAGRRSSSSPCAGAHCTLQ